MGSVFALRYNVLAIAERMNDGYIYRRRNY